VSDRFPDRYFVGVEQRKKYAEAGQKRVDAEAHGDVDLLHADVKLAVPVIFDPEQIAEVFIPFPDPWWKTQHRKRRVVRQEFLDTLEPKLAPGAKLWIRTDVGPFAEDMRRQLRRHADYEEIPFDDIPARPMARSTREDHLVEEALPIHLVYFRKNAQ
jgi:tRNA (guanine-N7-)-methyltransferase